MGNYYAYKELKKKALSEAASQEDVNKLGYWFEKFGSQFWNGESFFVEKDLELKPVYKPNYPNEISENSLEPTQYELIGFEFVGANAPWRSQNTANWVEFNDGWFRYHYCSNCGFRTMEPGNDCPSCHSIMIKRRN